MKGGSDHVRADKYTNDKDVVEGGSGFDLIYVDDGDTRDRVDGGGRSKCYVDSEVRGLFRDNRPLGGSRRGPDTLARAVSGLYGSGIGSPLS